MDIRKHMKNVECNICGSNDYKIVFKDKYKKLEEQDLIEKFKASGDETLVDQVVKCNVCGFVYINPRIDETLIIKGYSEGEDPTFVSQAKGREITSTRSMKIIEKYSKKGKILDIGTAGGTFLHVAKKRGWEVQGVEPNKWMSEWGKKNYGIDIYPGTIFDKKYKDQTFDVVTLWDVLEHVPDARKVIKECKRILKDDGLFVVNYPDINSKIAKILGRKWPFWLSVHLYYFTPKTIKKMLRSEEFKVLKIKPHVQTLQLGYLIFRMKEYSKFLHKIGTFFVKLLRIGNIQIPYLLGQTLVVARKIK